ncbi:MAG: hypothetical protein ACI8P0_003103 [Planctomycetaceae bacterium]|jgi:hypothetical protein
MSFSHWLERFQSQLGAATSQPSRKRHRKNAAQVQVAAPRPEQLELRLLLSAANYNAATDQLTLSADVAETDDVTITSPAANTVVILVGNGDAIVLAGDAIANADFVVSTTTNTNDTLTIDTSGSPLVDFNVDLGDQNDSLSYSLANATIGVTNVALDGGAGTATLVGTSGNDVFDVTAANAGTINSDTAFTTFENLRGAGGDDQFIFGSAASRINGDVDGQAGTDTLSYAGNPAAANVTLTGIGTSGYDGVETGLNSLNAFLNVDSLIGTSAGNDFIGGLNVASTWVVTEAVGTTSGSYTATGGSTLNLSAFESHSGGATAADTFNVSSTPTATLSGQGGDDAFNFATGAVLTGTIFGGGSNDTLSFAASSTDVTVTLTATTPVDGGFSGTTGLATGGFRSIDKVAGGSGDDTLAGLAAAGGVWTVDTTSTYVSTNSLEFLGIDNLAGSSAADTFNVMLSATVDIDAGGIIINAGNGDDRLMVDVASGNIDREITFNGGGQTIGDELALTGGGTFASVTHRFINASDGSIAITGNSTVNYTGLEPINDNLNATDRVFEFTGAGELITLSDDGDAGDGQSFIDSVLGESVTFNNPTDSLTIEVTTNGGSGSDFIAIEDLDSTFDADLTINGGDDDLVVFDTDEVDLGTGDLLARGIAIGVFPGGSITTNGGSLTFETTEEIFIVGNVSSNGGDIIFNADTDQAVTPGGSVIIEDAMVTSGGGNIVIGGGADPTMTPTIGMATAPHPDGFYIHNSIVSSGAGDISIRGSAANDEDGVDVGGSSTISATTGSITIIGDSTGMDDGVDIHEGSTISTTSGNVTITGTASGGTAEDGVLITGNSMATPTRVTTATGMITITGNGDDEDSGVEIGGFVLIESTGAAAGAITIDGTSATPEKFVEAGTFIDGPVVIRSVTGPIDITGTSSNVDGLVFADDSLVESTGTGATAAPITLTGDGGEVGLVVFESTVSSVDGNILIDGTGVDAEGVLLVDGLVESTGTTTATAATITILGDTTGLDSDGIAVADDTTGSLVTSVAGAISLTGTADSTSMSLAGVLVESMSQIASTGTGSNAGNITVNGTSGVGNGVHLDGLVTSVDGAISITGDASNGTEGVFVDNAIAATGTGAVSITGTGNAASGTPTGIFFDGNVLTDTGSITVLALVGRVVIDSEQTLESLSSNVSVTTTDTAGTGDSIELNPLGAINALAGMVTLTSGDDILLPVMAGVFADSLIRLTVDAGDADTGTGGNANLLGFVFADSLTGTGGPDNDLIILPSGMFGFAGTATLTGNGGDDTLTGGDGSDSLDGGAGADSLDGGGGADTLTSGAGNDMIIGGAGADEFQWNIGDGSDMFDGGADADSITTGAGFGRGVVLPGTSTV